MNTRECSSSPAVERVSKIQNLSQKTKDEILNELNTDAVGEIEALNVIADSYLAANSIVLKAKRSSGIQDRLRKKWEIDIIRSHPNVRRRTLERAIDNNLYDNLLFKYNVLDALIGTKPSMPPEQRNTIRREVTALQKALSTVSYRDIDFKVGTSAVDNGAGMQPTPKPVFVPPASNDNRDDIIIEDLDDLDDLDNEPTEPIKIEESPAAPPAPPMTIRRP